MNRTEMLEQLRQRTCRVIFKKVDGDERDMQCTLQEDVLPEKYQSTVGEEPAARQINENVIRAWDINKGAFRSFRVENVVSFT
jgi:hypothetical protein